MLFRSGRSLGADYVLHTEQFDTFSPVVADRLRTHSGIDEVAAYRFSTAKINGSKVELQGVEAKPLVDTLKVKTLSGDITSIDHGQLAVSETVAKSRNLRIGQRVDVVWSRTGNKPMFIGAIYEQNLFAGDYLVGGEVVDDNVTDRLLGVVAVTLKPGVAPAQARKVIDAEVKAFPNIEVQDQAELVAAQRKQVDNLLNVVTGLLVFSVLIAVLGIINTLALSVIERTRELGLLRAVGLGRRQLRRMIRVESVLIALYGALLGIVIGLAFGVALVHALKDQGIDTFAVPYSRIVMRSAPWSSSSARWSGSLPWTPIRVAGLTARMSHTTSSHRSMTSVSPSSATSGCSAAAIPTASAPLSVRPTTSKPRASKHSAARSTTQRRECATSARAGTSRSMGELLDSLQA